MKALTNLELNVSYDSGLSSINFGESFHVIQYSGVGQSSILVFTHYGNVDGSQFEYTDLDNYDLSSGNKKEIITFIKENYSAHNSDLNGESMHYFGKYFAHLNKLELIEFVENTMDTADYVEFLQNTFTTLYREIESRGYSQGDHSYVVIPKEVIENKSNDCAIDDYVKSLKEDIDHLIWDAPIYARLTFDLDGEENEIYLDELQKDRYSWDKSETTLKLIDCLDMVNDEQKDIIIEWFEENAPTDPEWL